MDEEDVKPVSRVAEPVLASSIWAAHCSSTSDHTSHELPPKRRKLRTFHQPIDTALHGGLDYGSVCCISSEAGSEANELAECLLTSHLLGSSTSADSGSSTATYIDAAQTLDVRRLYRSLTTILEVRGSTDLDDIPKAAMASLDRLRIMKVFDFVGLSESIAEMRDGMEGRINETEPSCRNLEITKEQSTAPRGTISDSQDDEEDELDSSNGAIEAMPKIPLPKTTIKPDNLLNIGQPTQSSTLNHLLLIDNLPAIFTPLQKTNHAHGNALLTSFLRSIVHLTRTHGLCTILLNPTGSMSNSSSMYGRSKAQKAKDEPRNSPSIFTSCKLRPPLGMGMAYLVDVHLLVHRIPWSSHDARIVYGHAQGEHQTNGELVSVLEALQDRHDRRVGRWAPFRFDATGRLNEVLL